MAIKVLISDMMQKNRHPFIFAEITPNDNNEECTIITHEYSITLKSGKKKIELFNKYFWEKLISNSSYFFRIIKLLLSILLIFYPQ